MTSRLRAIPSVEKVMQALGETGLPRPIVLDVVRRQLDAMRRGTRTLPESDVVLDEVRAALHGLRASRIQIVINGTGVVIHTNFGRAPLGGPVVERLAAIAANYSNLEYGLAEGARGGRAAFTERGLALLCAAQSATVVNNNAAALVLILRHFCGAARNEVIISRGELVQIGGGFRIPDVLESSGARLREVGTTNKTTLGDYAGAIGAQTALILKVHRSNFFMDGFVESTPTEELAVLARKKRIPFVEDLGSGAIVDTRAAYGLEHEPTPAEVLRLGVDLVCFSGDKLLGGPQAGIIAGRSRFVAALKREPLFRALRCDKLILAALEATVEIYLRKSTADKGAPGVDVPLVEMLQARPDDLRVRAGRIVAALESPLTGAIGSARSQIGGGALPRSALESVTVDVSHQTLSVDELARRLREQPVPVIGYIARGKLRLDLRTIFPRQDAEVVQALRAACRA